MSLDGGDTWDIVPGPVEGGWGSVTGVGIAGDNQTMVLCANGGRCYRTSNRWSSYSEIQPIGDANGDWGCIAISGNGLVILVAERPGRIYLSTDGGATPNWPETQPGGDSDHSWRGLAVGADNQAMLACEADGLFYRAEHIVGPWFMENINGEVPYDWWSASLGGASLYAIAMGDPGGTSQLYRGTYAPPEPPEPPGPPVFPVIDKFGIEGFYAPISVDEVEILPLPVSSDFVDIDE
jgi:hypothetical protein